MEASGVPAVLLSEMFPPAVGGTAVLYENLYRRLGVPVRVLTNDRAGRSQRFEYESGIRIDSRLRGIREPGALRQHVRLARVLRQNGPAVVHCGRALPEGLPAMLASATRTRLPFVAWVHGEEMNSARQSREHHVMMRLVHRRATLLLASSRNALQELSRSGVAGDKVRIVYPGVEAGRFAAAAPVQQDGGPVLLTVGRLQRRKGHDLVLKALPAVLQRHPTTRYLVVGDGEERPRLERLALELGVAAHVTFVGEVSEECLPRYFASADVFVMPNRVEQGDFEGFGIVFLEAAAAAKPVIGGRSGGVPEAVAEGESGLLVGGEDVEELVKQLELLLGSPELRQRLGAAGKRRVEQEFSWDASSARLRAAHDEAARRARIC